MGGGLMQLVAYGAQDIYLTGNPQITFFKVVYRRHTNFSMETIQQSASGVATVGQSENEASFTIARSGDLIHKVYLTADGSSHKITKGSKIIKEVEISIGGQKIDRYTQEWQDIWNELTTTSSKSFGLKCMTSDIGGGGNSTSSSDRSVTYIQIPLLFWFCRNPGLALPLIALQYHEVKIDIIFNKLSDIGDTQDTNLNLVLYVDYIYLDTDERRRFAQVSHEYLIEQLQILETNDKIVNNLNFNHPVKEIIWTSAGLDQTTTYGAAQIKLNGHDRFSKQKEEYFQLRQPYDYHTSIPHQNLPKAASYAELISNFSFLSDFNGIPLKGFTFESSADNIDDFLTNRTDSNHIDYAYGFVTDKDFSSPLNEDFNPSSHVLRAHRRRVALLANLTLSGHRLAMFFPNQLTNGHQHPLNGLFKEGNNYELKGRGKTWIGSVGESSRSNIEADATIKVHKVISINSELSDISVGNDDANYLQIVQAGPIACTIVVFNTFLFGTVHDVTIGDGSSATTGHQSSDIYAPSLISISLEGIDQTNHQQASTSHMTKNINVYSFALKPEEHQPSGTCNFSRIDTAQLITDTAIGLAYNIYAVNYNVLRIMSGMGGLAYSN